MDDKINLQDLKWFRDTDIVKQQMDIYEKEKGVYKELIAIAEKALKMHNVSYCNDNKKPLFYHVDSRVKEKESFLQKLWKDVLGDNLKDFSKSSVRKCYKNIHDKGGIRLVVEVERDIKEVVKEAKKVLKEDAGFAIEVRGLPDKDFKKFNKRGYLAYHFYIRRQYPIDIYDSKREWFILEVQVRSLTQDLWANFSHLNFYKPFLDKEQAIPELENEHLKIISNLLVSTDDLMQQLIDRITNHIKKENTPCN